MSNGNTTADFPVENEIYTGGLRTGLPELVAELRRQQESKLDVVINGSDLGVMADADNEGGLVLYPATRQAAEFFEEPTVRVRRQVIGQLANSLSPSMPTKFVKSMLAKDPEMIASWITELMNSNDKRRLVRFLDGSVRAYLGGSYRRVDHLDVMFETLEIAKEVKALPIACSLSETHMRITYVGTNTWKELDAFRKDATGAHDWKNFGGRGNAQHVARTGAKQALEQVGGGGNSIHPICTISNSETGHGSTDIRYGWLDKACVNECLVERLAGQAHIGGKLDVGVYGEDTIAADTKATMLKLRDHIKVAFSEDKFDQLFTKLTAAQETQVQAPKLAVEAVGTAAGLSQADQDAILMHFVRDYDQTAYGLAGAITRYAQDVDAPDKGFDLSRVAGDVIKRPKTVAMELATA